MFAGNATKLYDVTFAGTPTLIRSGQTSGNYTAAQMANQGGDWMIVANHTLAILLLRYNGTAWIDAQHNATPGVGYQHMLTRSTLARATRSTTPTGNAPSLIPARLRARSPRPAQLRQRSGCRIRPTDGIGWISARPARGGQWRQPRLRLQVPQRLYFHRGRHHERVVSADSTRSAARCR